MWAPSIPQAFFTDDNFICCNVSLDEAIEIKDVLDDYCDLLGQLVNFNKSAVYFSKGPCITRCKSIAPFLGVSFMENNEK